MKNKIGKYQIVDFTTLLIPEREKATFEFEMNGETQTFSLLFLRDEKVPKDEGQDKEETRTPSIEFSGTENELDLVFKNWDSPFGMHNDEPMEVGSGEDGTTVYILSNITRIGHIYRAEIQTMLAGGGRDD